MVILPLWRRSLLMAGRTFSASSSGTLTRTVSPLLSELTTRTWSQRSLLAGPEAGGATAASGGKSMAAAAAVEKDFRYFLKWGVISETSLKVCPGGVEERAVVDKY